MKILGLDISPDHGGLVTLGSDGIVIDYAYLTTTKKSAEIDLEHSILLSKQEKEEPKETFRLRRMEEYLEALMVFERKVSVFSIPAYYSIEGYAYASQSTSICQIAELTGHLKHYIFNKEGNRIRIHDPLSVKLFATNKGNASKKDVVEQALLAFDIPEGLIKKKLIKKKKLATKIEEYDGASTDLADAYFLARMMYKELQLRQGNILLNQLSEGERRIFLRVTRGYPINILEREFIQKEKN